MNDEQVVRELAAALPEAFDGVDLEAEFLDDSDDTWLPYGAISRAWQWIEEHSLQIRRDRRAAEIRAGGNEPLARFTAYVERLAATQDPDMVNLLLLEIFEDGDWVVSVADRFGPHTRALLQQAGLLPVRSPRS